MVIRLILLAALAAGPCLADGGYPALDYEAALTDARDTGRLVLLFVGTDSLPLHCAVRWDVVAPAIGDVDVAHAGLWLGASEGRRYGPGLLVTDAEGAPLARVSFEEALAMGPDALPTLVERGQRLRALLSEGEGSLAGVDRRELLELAAGAGRPELIEAALAGDEPSVKGSLLLAEAHWRSNAHAECGKILRSLPGDTLAMDGGLPRIRLAEVAAFAPAEGEDPQRGFDQLRALAQDDSLSGELRARCLADLAASVESTDTSALSALFEAAAALAPRSPWSLALAFQLMDAAEGGGQGVDLTALVERVERQDPGGGYARLMRARLEMQRTGERAAEAVANGPPVLPVVVIAGDESAFMRELRRWPENARWPVLLEDAWYSRLFIEAFEPEAVYYAPALGEPTTPHSLALPAHVGSGPAAAVLYDPSDGMECAAALYAAGHRVPAVPVQLPGKLTDTATHDECTALRAEIDAALANTQLAYDELGDAVDFVAVAADLPYRTHYPVGLEPGVRAMDDVLFRGGDDIPWAFAGRLGPDPAYAVYQVSCSLFLGGGDAYLFDTYGDGRPWGAFRLSRALPAFEAGDASADLLSQSEATLSRWHNDLAAPLGYRRVAVNSSGGFRDWSVDTGGIADDILHVGPAFVSYTHSHAAGRPLDPHAITGRWIALGAYGFFGALNEPYLQSFRAHGVAVGENQAGWPAAVAFRKRPGDFYWTPWKNALLGDPLASGMPVRRIQVLPEVPLEELAPQRLRLTNFEELALRAEWEGMPFLADPRAGSRDAALSRAALIHAYQGACDAADLDEAVHYLARYLRETANAGHAVRLARRMVAGARAAERLDALASALDEVAQAIDDPEIAQQVRDLMPTAEGD